MRPDGETPPPTPPNPYRKIHGSTPRYRSNSWQDPFAFIRDPPPRLPERSESPFQLPIPFPPAIYLASSANDALVRKYDLRRKPLPRLARPLEEKGEEEVQVLVRQSSWPIMRPAVVLSGVADREMERTLSIQRKPMRSSLAELDGRSLTPEELLAEVGRPVSAP